MTFTSFCATSSSAASTPPPVDDDAWVSAAPLLKSAVEDCGACGSKGPTLEENVAVAAPNSGRSWLVPCPALPPIPTPPPLRHPPPPDKNCGAQPNPEDVAEDSGRAVSRAVGNMAELSRNCSSLASLSALRDDNNDVCCCWKRNCLDDSSLPTTSTWVQDDDSLSGDPTAILIPSSRVAAGDVCTDCICPAYGLIGDVWDSVVEGGGRYGDVWTED